MAVAPRSSLRSLVLLVSHGKPRVSSFFSSSASLPPGNCAPDASAVQPPAAPVLPDSSSRKSPPNEETPIDPIPDPPPKKGNAITESSPNPERPKHPAPPERSSNKCAEHEELVLRPLPGDTCGDTESVGDKPSLYAVDEDPRYPTPDDDPCRTIPDPRGIPKEGVKHLLPDPPPRRP